MAVAIGFILNDDENGVEIDITHLSIVNNIFDNDYENDYNGNKEIKEKINETN